MEVTDVRIKLVNGNRTEKLLAYCTVTFDHCFIVRDMRIIEGSQTTFVAMPVRRLKDKCPSCGTKNHLMAKYCNTCGRRLGTNRAFFDEHNRLRLYADVSYPITPECRKKIEIAVLDAYEKAIAGGQEGESE